MAGAAAAGVTIPVIAGVAVFTDEPSAAVLERPARPGARPGRGRAVLAAADPIEAGIAAAVREATALLAVPGVAGVNLSGLGSARGYPYAASVKAELARRIREESAP